MTDAPDHNTRPSTADKAAIEALIAACIEALESGDTDPATRICAERPDLLTRVQRRLAQLAARGLITEPDLIPERIGPYGIVRALGSGGMGTVYLAEQTAPVRRQVALKVIKLGMDTREVVARFQAEQKALALMNHPHIAQVFDAGITADGRPFFAMEYVAGENLTTFCDQQKLATADRMRLLATVCRAVQHAHDRGFIHRDLKPSNVLVAEHGGQFTPKVIDFGIAKAAANAALADDAMRTRIDQVLGTPEYMSPEHARSGGLDVDTRADVYSLGVVLYELLCGELPFEARRRRLAMANEPGGGFEDELPTLPSRRLLAAAEATLAARGATRVALRRSVAGELDWITLKALAGAREQRYPSALALAEDLERWLAHQPVLAAPPGHGYRLRKFVRRNRVFVSAAMIVLLTLVTGLAVSLRAMWQAERARAQETAALVDMRAFYGLAQNAIGNLVDVADNGLADVPMADAVRRRMLADAITFYEGLRARQPGDLELRIDLAFANQRIGFLQQRLGAPVDAVATLREAVESVQTLCREAPTNRRLLAMSVAAPNLYAGALFATGQTEAGKAALRQGLEALASARGAAADALPNADAIEAMLLGNLAWQSDDQPAHAIELFERALAAYARAPQLDSTELAQCLTTAARYAESLTQKNRVEDAARVLTENATRLPAATAATSPHLREVGAQLASQTAEVLRRLQRHDEACAAQQRAIAAYHALATDHPDVLTYADGEAAGLHFLAQMQLAAATPAAAIEAAANAVAIRERLAAAHPQDHRLRARTARSLLLQASAEIDQWQHHDGPKGAAEATLGRAVTLADALAAEHAADVESLLVFAATHTAIGALRSRDRQLPAALAEHIAVRDTLLRGLAPHETNAELHYLLASAAANILKVTYQMGRFDDAVDAGLTGLEHVERGLQLDARYPALLELAPDLATLLATAQFKNGDADASMATLLRTCERTAWGPDAREQACLLLVNVAAAEGHPARRERLQQAATQMRGAIAARGSLAEALQRPVQLDGYSRSPSRLRDFDLRLALGQVLQQLDDPDGQAAVLAEAEALAESLPRLAGSRARNLCDQRALLLLAAGDPGGAARCVEAMLQRVGEAGGGNYLAAVLFSRCCAATTDDDAERMAARAVDCLRLALQHDEVNPEAVRHPAFAPLRARGDYLDLLAK